MRPKRGRSANARRVTQRFPEAPSIHRLRGLFFGRGYADYADWPGADDSALHHGHREGRDAIRQAREAAEVDADLVELRLDSMTSPDPEAALAGRRKPAIVTCRPLREGGMFDGSEEERLRILERAQALGAEFVDIEWDIRAEPFVAARGGQGRDRVAPRLPGRAGRSAGTAAAAARDRRGSRQGRRHGRARVRPAEAPGAAPGRTADSVLIGMGRAGLATRVLAGAVRLAVDLCGKRRRPGTGLGHAAAGGVQVPADSSRRRASTCCSAGPRPTRCRPRCTTPVSPRSA